jgi:hypothetical protein
MIKPRMMTKPRKTMTSYVGSTRTAPLPDRLRKSRVDSEATTFQFGKGTSDQIDSLAAVSRIPSHRGRKKKHGKQGVKPFFIQPS